MSRLMHTDGEDLFDRGLESIRPILQMNRSIANMIEGKSPTMPVIENVDLLKRVKLVIKEQSREQSKPKPLPHHLQRYGYQALSNRA
jgi:hypothetical protein